MLLISGPGLIGIVILLTVASYAAGYFRVRKTTDFSHLEGALPNDSDGSIRAVYESYGTEIQAKYARNHSRRHADKRLKEFALASVHFFVFTATTALTVSIPELEAGFGASVFLLALTLIAMALKAGQLTAAQEDIENKERLLVKATERVSETRSNAFDHCSSDLWHDLVTAREDHPAATY